MIKEEISVYEKEIAAPPPKKRRNISLGQIDKAELIEYAIMFLFGKLSFLGGISPFGAAYFAAVFPVQKRSFGILFICLGITAGLFGIESLKYMGAIAIISAFSIFMKEELKGHSAICASISAASIFANGLIYVIFDGFLIYDVFFLILESIITFFSYFLFEKASALIREIKQRSFFEAEETISLLILFAGVILSIKSFTYLDGAAHTISIVILLTLGYACGSQVSAAGGVALGLVNAIGAPLAAQTVSIYALCGFFCGMFKKYGKWAVSASFLVINALFMIYFNNSTDRLLTVGYILAATMIFFLLPNSFISRFGKVVEFDDPMSISPEERLREMLTEKISSVSKSFLELSGIFKKVVDEKISPDFSNIDRVYDRVYKSVCQNCSMNKFCWNKKANDTYDSLGKMYEMMKLRGYALEIDAPLHFKDYCINFATFLGALNREYEHFRINYMWAGKIVESRKLIASQFSCISNILNKITGDINRDYSNTISLERKILTALDKKGISAGNVCVTNNGGYVVTMTKNSCNQSLECSKVVASVIGEVLQVPMLRVGRVCSEDVCKLKFCEQARFRVETGGAVITKDGESRSGDNFSTMLLEDGRFVTILSDGAGSGKKASAQSLVTVEMLKRLIRLGFDKESSTKFLNSIFLSQDTNEIFATVDICAVNLYTGTAEFLKTGAAASFIKREKELTQISTQALPAGAIADVETKTDYHNLLAGDYIVMVTDGIIDAFNETDENIMDVISSFDGGSAQELSEQIMSCARSKKFTKIKDDMTVFCIKISEEM